MAGENRPNSDASLTESALTVHIPVTQLPAWDVAELPEPQPLRWRNWKRFVGPGLLMMGANIGGGEWLLGPEVAGELIAFEFIRFRGELCQVLVEQPEFLTIPRTHR